MQNRFNTAANCRYDGLRVETVIRVIRKLKEKGRLTINRGKVFLVNSDSSHKRFI
jgi:hypothetical protein